MKKLILAALLLINLQTFAQEGAKQVFESPKMKETISQHKIVAILPFTTGISYKRPPKNFDPETNRQDEKKLSKDLQNEMFTFFTKKKR